MKPNKKINWMLKAALPALAVVWVLSSAAAPKPPVKNKNTSTNTATTNTNVINRSVFIQPASPKEGRDPFFPDSSRPYAAAVAKTAHNTLNLTSLIFKGISGTPDHRLVIINNHTFAVGDEGDVETAQGRIHIRCLEISDYSVVIEAAGQRHELSFTGNR